ncbi:hypothetical protein D8Y22_00035 [Salinadaptatus halalkaliphilus]|uniref:Uncharacterized protein n=1 Tax=Salinadaptatus halalkaliphilus TaxID=2419781 RepID=A0A4S3TT03_9EURY|nr:hypothetical protein [Salinadaptatus halalkaliphilus]THE66565.1 hypothetical protein D8Y22_00035 [Salinadaptatus halalkaliphilus]
MNRRGCLALAGSGATIGLSGCVFDDSAADDTTDNSSVSATNETNGRADSDEADTPRECPVTQDLEVTPPAQVDENAVDSFLEEYESEYVLADIEASYDGWDIPAPPNTSVDDLEEEGTGLVAETQSIWSANTRKDVTISAEPREEVPDDVEPIDGDDLPDDAALAAETAAEAVDEDQLQRWRDRDQNYSLLTDPLESTRGEDDEYYVTVDETFVALEVTPNTGEIIDGNTIAWYYVDDVVARRTEEEDVDPADATIVECFTGMSLPRSLDSRYSVSP